MLPKINNTEMYIRQKRIFKWRVCIVCLPDNFNPKKCVSMEWENVSANISITYMLSNIDIFTYLILYTFFV